MLNDEEKYKLNTEIILPEFEFKKDIILKDDDDKIDENIIKYNDEDGNTHYLIVDDLKRRFEMNNYYNPYLFGKLLSDEFINNFKNKQSYSRNSCIVIMESYHSITVINNIKKYNKRKDTRGPI